MAVRVPPTAWTLRFHRRYATTSESTVAYASAHHAAGPTVPHCRTSSPGSPARARPGMPAIVVTVVTRSGVNPGGRVRSPTVYPAQQSTAASSVRRSTIQSSRLASANRIAVNGSGGICPMASLVTLKLTPQMKQTRSMPASWVLRRNKGGDGGEGGEGGEDEKSASGLV